jgi:hypothetical protein
LLFPPKKFKFWLLLFCRRTISANGLGIAEVGAFENRQFKYSKKADRRTLVELLPSAPILAIPC